MSVRLVSLFIFTIVLSILQVRCDGPSLQECVGGPTAETDLGAISPSEVVVDVREVQQGDYVRVTLRFEYPRRNIAADIIRRTVMYTHVLRSSKKFLGFLLLAYGRNESAPLGSWYIPHQETTVPPKARYLDCASVRRSGVTHAGTEGFFRLNLQWRPPYDYIGRVAIKAKLSFEGSDLWTSLSSLPIEVIGRGEAKVSAELPSRNGELEKNISSFPIEVVGWGGEGRENSRALQESEDTSSTPSKDTPATPSTSHSDGPWKSVLIGGGQRSEDKSGGVKPRFLDEEGDWDRWEPWKPPKDREVATQRPVAKKEKDVWDRWDAWTAPHPEDHTTRRVLIGVNRRNGAAQNWDRWDQGETHSWNNLNQPGKTHRDEVSRTRDRLGEVETQNWWERATEPLLEESTTWRSVLMMPRKRKATSPPGRRRPATASTRRSAVRRSSTEAGSDVDLAAIDDEEFYTSVELEEKKEEERGKYELMKADFGSWDTKSGVTKQGPLGLTLLSAIVIILAST